MDSLLHDSFSKYSLPFFIKDNLDLNIYGKLVIYLHFKITDLYNCMCSFLATCVILMLVLLLLVVMPDLSI